MWDKLAKFKHCWVHTHARVHSQTEDVISSAWSSRQNCKEAEGFSIDHSMTHSQEVVCSLPDHAFYSVWHQTHHQFPSVVCPVIQPLRLLEPHTSRSSFGLLTLQSQLADLTWPLRECLPLTSVQLTKGLFPLLIIHHLKSVFLYLYGVRRDGSTCMYIGVDGLWAITYMTVYTL